jgi:hypothetical protein
MGMGVAATTARGHPPPAIDEGEHMHRQRLLGVTVGASLIAIASLASAQTWPASDDAARPMRGSYSGAPAGEGPGTQGSQAQVLQGNGAPLPDVNAPGVVIVVPPPVPASTTVIVPAPSDGTTQYPASPGAGASTQ